ncbi:MAG TPA: Hsp70 family protein, partial [Gemmataceae bacterium]|nr:Hsp70 family protein [Gemmataceae bacterium]
MARYLIGIDLGTTNSALAYIDLDRARSGKPDIHTFAVPQLVNVGELGRKPLLPSFLYLPGPHDLPAGATALPWNANPPDVIGEFARNHGSRIPGRLVTSAKSWLCHAGVDRTAPVLPWAAPPEVHRLSPLEVSARYLRHMVQGWNHFQAKSDDEKLEKQTVVLTVPASFDDVARNLTMEAAKLAGMENVTLLEEPQAAFYCWLALHPGDEISRLKPGMRCLVVDVGGGTSDFSLIRAGEAGGELAFIRDAVGDHLLLGGDNMDLALAKMVEAKLPGAGKLDAAQYGMLVQACRTAKETLLAPNPPPSFSVTLMGRGRSVIGGAMHTTLNAGEVRKLLFDGFFPHCSPDAEPGRGARTGLHEMGLPYVSDPAVTRHLAAFLKHHDPQGSKTRLAASGDAKPQGESSSPAGVDAILFNGGVFQPNVLQQRVLDVMKAWYDTPAHAWSPLVLTNPSLDLAVAWGAASFAWLRHSGGRRIGGGIPRSYYIGIEPSVSRDAESSERSGSSPLAVLCVAPQHLDEGAGVELQKPVLELALGQPVQFPLFSSTVREQDKAGAILTIAPDQLAELPPLHTVLRGGKRSTGAKMVPVTLFTRITEIGTLELFCVARDGNNRWRLEFNIRELVKEAPRRDEDEEEKAGFTDVWPEAQVQEAAKLIRGTFTAEDDPDPPPAALTKALESALEASREKWPTGLCRRLWETLAEVAEQRRRSPQHLSRWYHLAGYCLRPGFGDSLDKFRVEQLWKILHAARKDAAGKAVMAGTEGGADAWIVWRRVCGGLNLALQQNLFDRLRPILLPKGKILIKPGANELAEMWRAAASLERLDPKHKDTLGQALLKQVRKSPVPTYSFWALTRLGARVLFYGPLNAVVHPQVVQTWLDPLFTFATGNESERLGWAFCLGQLARRSGQRVLDVEERYTQQVLSILDGMYVPETWKRMVKDVVELEGEEQSRL